MAAEWDAIGAALAAPGDAAEAARRIVELGAELHERWRGLRAAMMALVATDPVAQAAYRRIQLRQLSIVERLRAGPGADLREADAVLMMSLERVFDAAAQGDLEPLGLDRKKVMEKLTNLVAQSLGRPGS